MGLPVPAVNTALSLSYTQPGQAPTELSVWFKAGVYSYLKKSGFEQIIDYILWSSWGAKQLLTANKLTEMALWQAWGCICCLIRPSCSKLVPSVSTRPSLAVSVIAPLTSAIITAVIFTSRPSAREQSSSWGRETYYKQRRLWIPQSEV